MTINCKGELIDLSVPKVMGILNLTPDSFYDGGRYVIEKHILLRVEEMLDAGASFIDLGGYSSRPGATLVSEEMELARILPSVRLLVSHFPEIKLSIDTTRSKVARECLLNGAAIINDISAGSLDENMLPTIAEFQVPYIMMHMRGNAQNMQEQTQYTDLVIEIKAYLAEKVRQARTLNIKDIIIDPGFGFAKTIEQNFELLRKTDLFKSFDLPILVGLSRKSMIHKTLDTTPQEALNGTTALHMIALTKGANILRAHDVREAMECILLHEQLLQ